MTGGSSDGSDKFDDDPTNPGSGSAVVNAVRNLLLSLHEVGRDLRECTERFEELERPEQLFALAEVSKRLGELGSICYDAQKAVQAIAESSGHSFVKD